MIGETMLLAYSCKSIRGQVDTLELPSEPGEIMNAGSRSLDSRTWRELYEATLFEVDKTKLPERIAQAEKALALRARELFYAAGNIEESQALDDAVHALYALRNTSQTNHFRPPASGLSLSRKCNCSFQPTNRNRPQQTFADLHVKRKVIVENDVEK